MPYLKIDVAKFTGTYDSINQTRQLDISEEQALHAAMTVGMPLLRKGAESARHALSMAAYKAVATKASIDFSKTYLASFPAYRHLDPSEKTNLSYWIGMVFTALLARELIGVSQVLHAACFKQRRIVKKDSSSRSLADLVGRDTDTDWHVFEAKGRQKRASELERDKWKAQSKTIRLIGGREPVTRSVCVAMIKAIYHAEFEDPEGDEGTVDIEFGRSGENDTLREIYYGSLRDVLNQNPLEISREPLTFVLTRVAFDAVTGKHVFIGMEKDAFETVVHGDIPKGYRPIKGTDFYLGPDSIVILTSEGCVPENS